MKILFYFILPFEKILPGLGKEHKCVKLHPNTRWRCRIAEEFLKTFSYSIDLCFHTFNVLQLLDIFKA